MSTDRILLHLPALCNQIRRIAIDVGEIILTHFDESGFQATQEKKDGSSVTIADQEAEDFIVKALKEIAPDTPIIGEELFSRGEAPDISNSSYFWLVDALDGTKEFISGSADFTVNIALIKDNAPVLGVVYAPYYEELYAGFGEGTAIRWNNESKQDKSIRTRKMHSKGLTVSVSKSHDSGTRLEEFLSRYKVAKLLRRGSSLKICMVAAGKSDFYPRLGPTCEWDIAAADAVIRAAGGAITALDKKPMLYKKDTQTFLNPEFIACSKDFLSGYESE